MGEVNEEITIAQNRADEIIFENASVFLREANSFTEMISVGGKQ